MVYILAVVCCPSTDFTRCVLFDQFVVKCRKHAMDCSCYVYFFSSCVIVCVVWLNCNTGMSVWLWPDEGGSTSIAESFTFEGRVIV